jgi:osmotically-inducible protein OsmY
MAGARTLQEKSVKKTNKELQADVFDELQYEPSIDAAGVGVIASDGIVTLTGTVKSWAERSAAIRVAERVSGVSGVVDKLEVEPPFLHERGDEDIARAALNTLKWHVFVPENRLKVEVAQGWITLEGKVDYNFQRLAAENAIRNLKGVKGVTNDILVEPHVTPFEVKSKIDHALRRAAELDADRIMVAVQNNTVTLRGNVSSLAERREAERAAWSAPGVAEVNNELRVAA